MCQLYRNVCTSIGNLKKITSPYLPNTFHKYAKCQELKFMVVRLLIRVQFVLVFWTLNYSVLGIMIYNSIICSILSMYLKMGTLYCFYFRLLLHVSLIDWYLHPLHV